MRRARRWCIVCPCSAGDSARGWERWRSASTDAFGSFVLSPLGAAIAGPLAVALGTSSALWLAAGALLVSNLTMLLIPAVWRIQARAPEGLRLRSAT